MSTASRSSEDVSASAHDRSAFSRDEVLEMLSNQRRRFVIHALKQAEGPMSVSELAERVASWEYDKPVEKLDHRERKRVRNALRQFHLSKMAEYGFLEYDAQRGTVSLSERAARENFYVDSLTGGDIPWGLYYLGFSLLATVAMGGAVVGVPPFAWVSPGAMGACIVVALLVSSVGHFYDNYYRMRLGAREEPAEVGE
jgi:predicted house-cleaning noncanonical NTP pyrophosphatase (MazG superfamily)